MGFGKAYDFTARWEGGLCDVPEDAGGITNFGISIVFLRDFAMREPDYLASLGICRPVTRATIRQLRKEQARAIMKREFWDRQSLDGFPDCMAFAMFDCAVNSGPGRACRCLQEALNKTHDAGLAVDGANGPKTKAALSRVGELRDLEVALAMVDARENFLRRLVSQKPSQKVFMAGWLNRLHDLRKALRNL